MKSKKAMLATAAISGLMMAATAQADNHGNKAAGKSAKAEKVKCVGTNSCKGQSACHTATSKCGGQNSCKGKGWEYLSKAECDKKKAAVKKSAGKKG